MNRALYNEISDCYDDRTKQDIVDEINKIIEVLEAEEKLYLSPVELVGFEFDLNTTSWQVLEANANGHYIVERQDNEYTDKYYIRNCDTNKVYSTDERTLKYLMSHTDCQDYKFIYVGLWGDYEDIGI
jgi:hypothetical protein